MRIFVVTMLMAVLIFITAGPSYSMCGMCGSGSAPAAATEEVEEGEAVNDVCPVMGSEIDEDTPYKVAYKGKTIGFCCPYCIKEFEKDPEKYMEKLEEEEAEEAEEETAPTEHHHTH